MNFAELITYLALEFGLVLLLAISIRRNVKTDTFSALHFSLLTTFAFQGLCSVAFNYTGILLSFKSLNYALLAGYAVTLAFLFLANNSSMVEKNSTERFAADKSVAIAMALSYLGATIAGLMFFSLDLVPSSMTGDPPRHYLNIIHLTNPGSASLFKPVYYLWAGLFTSLPFPAAPDRLFVAFNIFVLGLVTSSVTLLMVRIIEQYNWRSTLLIVLLTAFGYYTSKEGIEQELKFDGWVDYKGCTHPEHQVIEGQG